MFKNIITSIKPINSERITGSILSEEDKSLIKIGENSHKFDLKSDKVEFYVYDLNNKLLDWDINYKSYRVEKEYLGDDQSLVKNLKLDPLRSTFLSGYNDGTFIAYYNFITNELNSSYFNRYYIKEISSNRKELKVSKNDVDWESLKIEVDNLKSRLNDENFEGFYLTFNENDYLFSLNLEINQDEEELLILLYEPLPEKYDIKSQFYISTKISQSEAYEVSFTPDKENVVDESVEYLKGPNTNLEIEDFINNSTELVDREELFETKSQDSKNHLLNVIKNRGVKLKPDYTKFEEFINFSSAKNRIKNFITKVATIQEYESDLETLNLIQSNNYSNSNVESIKSKIQAIIKSFDGYEYFLYYNTSKHAYPQESDIFMSPLLKVDDPKVLEWLGSADENSEYYGGLLKKAYDFDNSNPNWLHHTIPEFIRENKNNENYSTFINMVGQHFDEIWLYIRAITEFKNTTNELESGIPLKLAQDAIESLGYKGLTNNFNNQNNYIGLTGEDDETYTPPTGEELITNYIAINSGEIVNYWDLHYSHLNYVEQRNKPGFPYAIDDVSKEIFKRLYHNISYLVKKKGTSSGLRQLINIWGIPDTILRISEFGGKNTDEEDDYDLWYNRFSYAYTPTVDPNLPSSVVRIPWTISPKIYEYERIEETNKVIHFRFKAPKMGGKTEETVQHLLSNVIEGDTTFILLLRYKSPNIDSHKGAIEEFPYEQGTLELKVLNDDVEYESSEITSSFFNGEWWSVSITKHPEEIELKVGSKHSKGENSNSVKTLLKTTIKGDNLNLHWGKYQVSPNTEYGLNLGYKELDKISFPNIQKIQSPFLGSFQELRIYSHPQPEDVFLSYIMNPRSIESKEIQEKYKSLTFRAPLGNELENLFKSETNSESINSLNSVHPKYTESESERSFLYLSTSEHSDEYHIKYYEGNSLRTFSSPNKEEYYLDQPVVGIKNRVSNRIEIKDNNNYGDILSPYISIEQDEYDLYTPNQNQTEVAFSPQNEINDEIMNSFGYMKLSEILGDPRNYNNKETNYPQIRNIAKNYFQTYSKGNVYDYLRLIKYFDNSIFRALKNYTPARSSMSTGIVIKSHLLERNKYPTPSINHNTPVSLGSKIPLNLENLEIDANLELIEAEGGTGGVFKKYNNFKNFNYNFGDVELNQSWVDKIITPIGEISLVRNTQKEFYDGVLKGNNFKATQQSLLHNPYLQSRYVNYIYNFEIIEGQIQYFTAPSEETDIQIRIISPGGSIEDLTNLINDDVDYHRSNIILIYISRIPSVDDYASSEKPNESTFQVEAVSIPLNEPNSNYGWEELRTEIRGIYPDDALSEEYDSIRGRPPYFSIKLPNPSNGARYKSGTDNQGMRWDTIYSSTLNIKETGINQINFGVDDFVEYRYFLFETSKFIETSKQKLIKFDSHTVNFSGVSKLSFGDFSFLSPLRTKTIVKNSTVSEGEAKFVIQPLTNTTPFDHTKYIPIGLKINNQSQEGDSILNNITQNEEFKFTLKTPDDDDDGYKDIEIYNSNLEILEYNQNESNGNLEHTFLYGENSNQTPKLLNNITGVEFEDSYIEGIDFQNSVYYPINNNSHLIRDNTVLMEVDYDGGVSNPINLEDIMGRKANKASTPLSNYTSLRNSYSKYLGSKLKSLKYDIYTSPMKAMLTASRFKYERNYYLNGDILRSWEGDKSYGKTPVINVYPRYIAYFDESYEDYSLWNTHQYNIKTLIEIPDKELEVEDLFKSDRLQVKGDNTYLQTLTGNFLRNKDISINFNEMLRLAVSKDEIEPENLSQNIHASGNEYIPLFSNQISETEIKNEYNFLIFDEDIKYEEEPDLDEGIIEEDPVDDDNSKPKLPMHFKAVGSNYDLDKDSPICSKRNTPASWNGDNYELKLNQDDWYEIGIEFQGKNEHHINTVEYVIYSLNSDGDGGFYPASNLNGWYLMNNGEIPNIIYNMNQTNGYYRVFIENSPEYSNISTITKIVKCYYNPSGGGEFEDPWNPGIGNETTYPDIGNDPIIP